jgi:hypothetical protein
MNTNEKIHHIISHLLHSNYFRTEYAEDGYMTITKNSDDSYEIDIQHVDFLDQATHTLHYCNSQELAGYLERHIDQLQNVT